VFQQMERQKPLQASKTAAVQSELAAAKAGLAAALLNLETANAEAEQGRGSRQLQMCLG